MSILERGKEFDFGLHNGEWCSALVGASFDGASVMLGKNRGLAAKMQDVAPCAVFLHAAAHVVQLATGEAFKVVEYVEEWRRIVQDVYCHYNQSGKKKFGLEEVAKALDITDLLKVQGTHGIRWVASQRSTITALMRDLRAIIVDLELTAKRACGCEFTTLSDPASFLWKKTKFDFEGMGSYTGQVRNFNKGSNATLDSFDVYFTNDRTTVQYSRAEVVLAFTDEARNGLAQHDCWILMTKLQQFRFVSFTQFMLDVHDPLSQMSKSFQKKSGIISDIVDCLAEAIEQFDALLEKPGKHESAFIEAVADDNVFCGTVLQGREASQEDLETDKKALLNALKVDSKARFLDVLENPVLKWFAIFDHRSWPPSDKVGDTNLADYGNQELVELLKTYAHFFDDVGHDEVMREWKALKKKIQSTGQKTKRFKALWTDAILQYQDNYVNVLRLVIIMLLIPTDTSECERLFSLMNNIKTAKRAGLLTGKTQSLMMWHYVWHDVKPCDFPVRAVLDQILADVEEADRKLNRHRVSRP